MLRRALASQPRRRRFKKGPTDSLTSCVFYYLNITKAAILSAAPIVMFNLVPGFPRRHTWNFSLSGKQPPPLPLQWTGGFLRQCRHTITFHRTLTCIFSSLKLIGNTTCWLTHSGRKDNCYGAKPSFCTRTGEVSRTMLVKTLLVIA